MKKIFLNLLIVCALFLSTSIYAQRTWQVSKDGLGDFTLIQAAINAASPGDIINVAAGVYDEFVTVNKQLTLLGATAGISKKSFTPPANYNYVGSGETVISKSNAGGTMIVTFTAGVNGIVFKGFVVQVTDAIGQNGGLVYCVANQNMVFQNNVIGPNVNLADAPYIYSNNASGQGRMGLGLYNSGTLGCKNSNISYNALIDTKGNGIPLFIYGTSDLGTFVGTAYTNPATDQSDFNGCVIDNNKISGSRRSGIEICGGIKGLVISNNDINNCTPSLPTTDPYYNHLKFGNGIAIIRIGSMYYSQNMKAGAYDFEIFGNTISNNSKCGIYMGPLVEKINIHNNTFQNNAWSAVYVDLTDQFYVNWPDPYQGFVAVGDNNLLVATNCATNVKVNKNTILGNGSEVNNVFAAVVGIPSNGFRMDATQNFWGILGTDFVAPLGSHMTPYVDYLPYFTDFVDGTLSIDGGFQGGNGTWYTHFGDALNNTTTGGTVHVGIDVLAEDMLVNKDITIDGTINLYPGAKLTVNPANHLTIANGNLNIKANNLTGMASVIEYGNITFTGKGATNVDLFLSGGAGPVYHYVTPTVAGVAKTAFTGNPTFFAFDETKVTGNNYNVGWVAPPATLISGQGYALHYLGASNTISYSGLLNTGNISISPLTLTPSSVIPAQKGWNLIGNPYPSAIDVDQIAAGNWSGVNAAIYYYKAAAQNYVYYVRKSGTSGNGGTNTILQGQGFFVQTRAASPVINFSDAIRLHSSSTPFYKSNDVSNQLSIKLHNGTFTDEAVIAFNDNATTGFDGDFDAWKMFSPVANIYTNCTDGELAINTIPAITSNTTIPLVLQTATEGNYSFSFDGLSNIDKNISVILEDTKLATTTDLRKAGTYDFSSLATTDNSRFILHFSLAAGISNVTNNNVNIYSYNNNVYVNLSNIKSSKNIVEIYNLLGELVNTVSVNNSISTFNIEKSGYYLIKVIADNNIYTEKVLIK